MSFSKTYNSLVDVGNSTKNRSSSAFYAYDAVWTIVNILQRARQTVERNGKDLNELSYGDVDETQLFQTLAEETDFNGVTVGVVKEFLKLLFRYNFTYVSTAFLRKNKR